MNLQKLFKSQAELDKRIVEKKGLQGVDLLPNLILALQVKLGKCAKEWCRFKFWSHDQKPRTEIPIDCLYCCGKGYMNHGEVFEDGEPWPFKRYDGSIVYGYKNTLLEEYVDCLNFILSIGLELNIPVIYGMETKWGELTSDETDITQQFLLVFENANKLVHPDDWINLFEEFYILGKMLGFTWEQIEQVYFEKNEENHKRQENGY